MKSEFDEPAYQLSHESYHFEHYKFDWQEDLIFQKYDGYEDYKTLGVEPFEHPDPVFYEGDLEVVRHIDYPSVDNNWHVMSKRMLATLLRVGSFPHRVIPIAIVNWEVPEVRRYEADGSLRKDILLWTHIAVQVTEQLNIFDYDKSEYDRDEDDPDYIRFIDKYVFKIPPEGLPPLFRIPEKKLRLFASAEGRSALKTAGIAGTRFLSLSKGKRHDKTDVPIILPKEIYTSSAPAEQQRFAEKAWKKQRNALVGIYD